MSSFCGSTLGPPACGATASRPSALAVTRAGLWTLFAAHIVAGWGTQWDIQQWHLMIGRDSFFIPPHLMTYSGTRP